LVSNIANLFAVLSFLGIEENFLHRLNFLLQLSFIHEVKVRLLFVSSQAILNNQFLMEAVSIFSLLGFYVLIRVLLGHHKTKSMKDTEKYKEGVKLIFADNFKDAHIYFSNIIQKDPQCAIAWGYRAEANYRLDNLYQCIADCNRAISIDYQLSDCYLFKGMALYDLEDFQDALTEFDLAVWHFREKHPETFRYRGLSHFALGNHEKAKYDFQRALKLGDEEANYYLMQIKKKLDVL
jgi:tetratricopeptide (TPR) repeat protein